MKHQEVKSSNIKSIAHCPNSNCMEVTFNNGNTYIYEGVKAEDHQALLKAESIGSHFHNNIKGKFKFKKKDPDKV